MNIIAAVLIFILGTAIGSFLSVVTFRLKHGLPGIVMSHSICPACKKKLKWRYLVPVFSWLFLRGKCGYCGKKISVHYLLIELTTGLAYLTSFLVWNFLEPVSSTINPEFINYVINWHRLSFFVYAIVTFTLLIAIFFYDLLYREIPDHFSLPAILIAVLGGLYFGAPSWQSMLIGVILLSGFFAVQFAVSKGKWIGGGDIRLGALIGAMLGWEKGLVALILAYLLGAIISVFLLVSKKATRKTAIAFGPFLIIGTVLTIFYGDTLLHWYLNFLIF